tara:strand:- start:482 stop:850 length:369 start_codon:yes stop_codon:yes gene_type:complete
MNFTPLSEERQTKKTELKLLEFSCALVLASKINISDTLTAVRIAPGVATATQLQPAIKGPGGSSVVLVSIRYVPTAKTPIEQIEELAKTLKIKGVKTIRIDTREESPVRREDGARFVVSGPG